jgi:hypothetical protein
MYVPAPVLRLSILLLFWITAASAVPLDSLLGRLPPLISLEQTGPERLLAVDAKAGLHRIEGREGDWLDLPVGGLMPGGQPLLLPGEVDARGGFQALLSDPASRRILQLSRSLGLDASLELPPDFSNLRRPFFLGQSATRTLVLCDKDEALLVAYDQRLGWRELLDFGQLGEGRPLALEVLGERVYLLLERGAETFLLMAGTEGGWLEEVAASGILAIHRDTDRRLLLLEAKGDSLRLKALPAADRSPALEILPARNLMSWPRPRQPLKAPLDILLLPEGLLLAAPDRKACLLPAPGARP